MDKAELLREFVFNAVPKGESLLRDPSGGQVRVQVRLLGFDGPPEFEEFGADASADAAPTAAMTRELEELFDAVRARSEEHTSELQSLMRISYAVFCLKKKKTHISRRYNEEIDKIT